MASVTQFACILLTCWSLTGQFMSEAVSENIMKLMTVYNGQFDNSVEILSGDTTHYYIQVTLLPVDIPALPGKPVLYLEETVDGSIFRRMFLESLKALMASFTVFLTTSPTAVFTTQILSARLLFPTSRQLTLLQTECITTFVHVTATLYSISFPDCTEAKIDGKYPDYNITCWCSGAAVSVPLNARERTDNVTYSFHPHGKRYPLLGAAAGYVGVCDKST